MMPTPQIVFKNMEIKCFFFFLIEILCDNTFFLKEKSCQEGNVKTLFQK